MVPAEVSALLVATAIVTPAVPSSFFRIFQAGSNADSMVVWPRHYRTVINKIGQFLKGKEDLNGLLGKVEKHKEWVVVKDPKRIKVVDILPGFEQYKEHEAELIKH